MTWTKLGSEFFPECMHHGLSDAATRTHAEAIAYLYEVEEMSCTIPKRLVRTFAGSESFGDAIEVLVALEWWKDRGGKWEILHHADVIRQSIAAQIKQRDRTKRSSRSYRERHAGESEDGNSTDGTTGVTGHVTADVTHHADRQTDKQLGAAVPTTCQHLFHPDREVDPWFFDADCDRCQKQAEGKSA